MRTVTISMRISEEEAKRLDRIAELAGIDRATLLRRSLRRGSAEVLYEQALELYRRGEASLSKAAEIAGITLREFILQLSRHGIELTYSPADLAQDLKG
jgi:predicted HTH domain antitoxin